MTNQFAATIPPAYLPLPTRDRRLPGHETPRIIAQTYNPLNPRPHNADRFDCSCGANPLNDPHNLAVLAGAYTPLTARHSYPDGSALTREFRKHTLRAELLPPSTTFKPLAQISQAPQNVRGRLNKFHTELWRLIPLEIQSLFVDTRYIDNARHFRINDENSPLLPFIKELWPNNFSSPDHYVITTSRQQDSYTRDEWFDWNQIHRNDQIAMNPGPYVQAATRSSRPYSDLGVYSPVLPVFHGLVVNPENPLSARPDFRPSPGDKPICGCGVNHAHETHTQHRYEAFIGRTLSRALEVHTQGWQEGPIGASTLRTYGFRHYSTYSDQAKGLELIMRKWQP